MDLATITWSLSSLRPPELGEPAPGKLSASSAWRCAEDGGKVVLEEPLEET
jgi:hypothetical protein